MECRAHGFEKQRQGLYIQSFFVSSDGLLKFGALKSFWSSSNIGEYQVVALIML